MEDGLGPNGTFAKARAELVLILVLMEDGLGLPTFSYSRRVQVLILVLMEDGLGLY